MKKISKFATRNETSIYHKPLCRQRRLHNRHHPTSGGLRHSAPRFRLPAIRNPVPRRCHPLGKPMVRQSSRPRGTILRLRRRRHTQRGCQRSHRPHRHPGQLLRLRQRQRLHQILRHTGRFQRLRTPRKRHTPSGGRNENYRRQSECG